jgi:hypothetical protein
VASQGRHGPCEAFSIILGTGSLSDRQYGSTPLMIRGTAGTTPLANRGQRHIRAVHGHVSRQSLTSQQRYAQSRTPARQRIVDIYMIIQEIATHGQGSRVGNVKPPFSGLLRSADTAFSPIARAVCEVDALVDDEGVGVGMAPCWGGKGAIFRRDRGNSGRSRREYAAGLPPIGHFVRGGEGSPAETTA